MNFNSNRVRETMRRKHYFIRKERVIKGDAYLILCKRVVKRGKK
jgi:hypothetical protein